MIRRVIDGRIDSTTGYRMIGRTEIEKDHAIYAVHCLRRRTSPRPYWIPLAAVDQNYKAEQRFGTSVRDSSPRYPLLPPRPRPFSRSTRSVSIDLPNAFDPVSLPFAPPPPLRLLLRFFLGRSTPRVSRNHWLDGFSRVRWRISRVVLSVYLLCPRCSTRKGWLASPCGFSAPFCQLED